MDFLMCSNVMFMSGEIGNFLAQQFKVACTDVCRPTTWVSTVFSEEIADAELPACASQAAREADQKHYTEILLISEQTIAASMEARTAEIDFKVQSPDSYSSCPLCCDYFDEIHEMELWLVVMVPVSFSRILWSRCAIYLLLIVILPVSFERQSVLANPSPHCHGALHSCAVVLMQKNMAPSPCPRSQVYEMRRGRHGHEIWHTNACVKGLGFICKEWQAPEAASCFRHSPTFSRVHRYWLYQIWVMCIGRLDWTSAIVDEQNIQVLIFHKGISPPIYGSKPTKYYCGSAWMTVACVFNMHRQTFWMWAARWNHHTLDERGKWGGLPTSSVPALWTDCRSWSWCGIGYVLFDDGVLSNIFEVAPSKTWVGAVYLHLNLMSALCDLTTSTPFPSAICCAGALWQGAGRVWCTSVRSGGIGVLRGSSRSFFNHRKIILLCFHYSPQRPSYHHTFEGTRQRFGILTVYTQGSLLECPACLWWAGFVPFSRCMELWVVWLKINHLTIKVLRMLVWGLGARIIRNIMRTYASFG